MNVDLAEFMREGESTLGLFCGSVAGPAAVMARIELEYADGQRQVVVTGKDWQVTTLESGADPQPPPENNASWHPATSLGLVAAHRWGLEPDTVAITPVDDYTQWMRAVAGTAGTDPQTFQVANGFTVELLRSATKEEDSWISLTSDSRGRWIIGMEKHGLLRLTLPSSPSDAAKVERINDALRECRGLVFAHDSLYAMANVDNSLFRLRDTNGNDDFDQVEKLVEFGGDAGHGRNQLTLGPDGELWGIFGDSVFEPESAQKLPPALAKPTPAEHTRSGFVARFNADASEIKVFARGLRNPFGISFNEHGDMFTYDADAEYDMGASWYRPTRVVHLLPGGDYGWRRVTQQWPPYFPDRADMPQPTLDIGKGSPTAVEFGTKSNFPPRYRSALFILDWAYGRIVAVHVTPRGSSYQAAAETFLRGQPLNVTDIEFGADGAMYFITGGRGTQSALYRVRYAGPPNETEQQTLQAQAVEADGQQARATRRQLETFLQDPDESHLPALWSHLGSADPWIRHAARAALERLPVAVWRAPAGEERHLDIALAARVALVRQGHEAPWLGGHLSQATERQSLELLYLAERLLVTSADNKAQRDAILAELRSCYPAATVGVNLALSRILSDHVDEAFVRKTLELMSRAASQSERLHYAFVLRHVTSGWSSAGDRRVYFEQLRQMEDFIGGEGLPTFRKLIRQEALAALPASERPEYERLLATNVAPWAGNLPPARTELVRKWSVDELAAAWEDAKTERDIAHGKLLFQTARCIVCHRAGEAGGVSGPDLTSVARRFSPRDILTSMLEPSKAIDEKYAAEVLELADGRVATGRIAPGDYRSADLEIVPNLLEPETTLKIAKADIVHREASPVSPMPISLLDCYSQDEILDLLAFLLAAERPSP